MQVFFPIIRLTILHHKQEQNNYLLEENWKAIGFANTLDYTCRAVFMGKYL